jgi:hypothetical protein
VSSVINLSSFIRDEEFIYQLEDQQLLKKDYTPPQNLSLHGHNIVNSS